MVPSYRKESWIGKISSRIRLKTPFAQNKAQVYIKERKIFWDNDGMSVEEYIQKCDPCEKRKEDREFRASLAEVEMPTTPFEVTSMDITGPYPVKTERQLILINIHQPFHKIRRGLPIERSDI